MKPSLRFTSPDGRAFGLGAIKPWFAHPCESTIQVSASNLDGRYPDAAQGGEMQSVYAGGFDLVASSALDARVESRLSVDGGEFLIYRSSRPDLQGLAVWRGSYHDLGAWIPPVAESAGLDPWARFAVLDIEDTPEGMLVRPLSGADVTVTVTDVTNYVEGVGMVYLHSPVSGLGYVPVRQGKKVRVGEVWKNIANRETRAQGAQDHFVIANRNAVAVLVPASTRDPEFTPQVEFMDSLTTLESGLTTSPVKS